MKIFTGFFIGILVMVCWPISTKAQDVYISVPETNIFNRTEFTTIENVLNTRHHTNWRARVLSVIWPEIQSTSGNNFSHRTLSGVSLPTVVLEWQLKSIGGEPAPFRNADDWPLPYKSFTTSSQYWYQPSITTGNYTAGNVAFNFRILSNKYEGNAFHAGEYSIGVTHNYTSSGWFNIEFTPNSFKTIISIPAAIKWISNTPIAYYEISSLDQYRFGAEMIDNLFLAELANTVGFNLMAKTSSSSIQFTSSKGVEATQPVSLIRLGSTNPKLITTPLSSTWKNYSSTNNFEVEVGNRNNFPLQLSILAADFKNHFFEAGTYKFQINFDAKSSDNTVSAIQNTDVTLKVLPLSEITIPTSGNEVNFEFNTASHYSQGQSKVVPNQIKLSNNETYELYVKSDAGFFIRDGIQSEVVSSVLQIGVEEGSQNVALSTTPQKIIENGIPVLDKNLNIKYTISATAAQSLVAKEKSTYSINVIYSFTAL